MADLSVVDLMVPSQKGRVLLSVGSLSVMSGQMIGVRGPSGAGKSTLLFALAGLIDTARGKVLWNGADILSMSPAQRAAFRAAHVGVIFQDFLLFDEMTAAGNAGLAALFAARPERAAIVNRAETLLTKLGVSEPNRTVDSFSGGERQRVAIARALASDASILLADEPTASLPRSAADALISDMSAMVAQQGKTLIAVSHDETLLARMDRVITISDGTLVAEDHP